MLPASVVMAAAALAPILPTPWPPRRSRRCGPSRMRCTGPCPLRPPGTLGRADRRPLRRTTTPPRQACTPQASRASAKHRAFQPGRPSGRRDGAGQVALPQSTARSNSAPPRAAGCLDGLVAAGWRSMSASIVQAGPPRGGAGAVPVHAPAPACSNMTGCWGRYCRRTGGGGGSTPLPAAPPAAAGGACEKWPCLAAPPACRCAPPARPAQPWPPPWQGLGDAMNRIIADPALATGSPLTKTGAGLGHMRSLLFLPTGSLRGACPQSVHHCLAFGGGLRPGPWRCPPLPCLSPLPSFPVRHWRGGGEGSACVANCAALAGSRRSP